MTVATGPNPWEVSPPPVPFPCAPESVAEVRRYVRGRVTGGGRADLADEAETVASELFANAVRAQLCQHVSTVISVQAIVQEGTVVLDVYDHADGRPVLRRIDPVTATSGRGLHMVDRITRGSWGWEPYATGKVVSAMITEPLEANG